MSKYNKIFKTGPIIICGMYSGGTTIVARLLQKGGVLLDADLHNYTAESFFTRTQVNQRILKGIWHAYPIQEEAHIINTMKKEEAILGRSFREMIHERMISRKYKEGPWGWKDPKNSILLSAIYKMFPDMIIVHVVRDVRDNVISLQNRHNARAETITSYSNVKGKKDCLEHWMNLWEAFHRRVMKYGNEHLKGRYFRVKYEDLCNKDSKMDTVEKLFRALKIGMTDEARKYVKEEAGVRTFSHADLIKNQKKYPNVMPETFNTLVGKWKKLPKDILTMLNNNKLQKELGY